MSKQIKLILVTGASGTGKSTLIPLLGSQLPNSYKVYDFDQIWKPYDFTEEWESGVMKRVVKLFIDNGRNGCSTVIAGLIRPQVIRKLIPEPAPEIKFCLLTVTVNERAKRLKERGASQELINDAEELVNLEKWLQESKYPFIKIDTTNLSPEAVANSLASWIKE